LIAEDSGGGGIPGQDGAVETFADDNVIGAVDKGGEVVARIGRRRQLVNLRNGSVEFSRHGRNSENRRWAGIVEGWSK
jgi:hypothetical protein